VVRGRSPSFRAYESFFLPSLFPFTFSFLRSLLEIDEVMGVMLLSPIPTVFAKFSNDY